jgi:hypothetical protein
VVATVVTKVSFLIVSSNSPLAIIFAPGTPQFQSSPLQFSVIRNTLIIRPADDQVAFTTRRAITRAGVTERIASTL